MDVFIPEEYVVRRRMERKEAAVSGNRSEIASDSGQTIQKEKKERPSTFGLEKNELLGQTENIVFNCFSA